MYSLEPISQQGVGAQQQDDEKNTTTTQVSAQPELWFNPKTNRWISKSCRVYRELVRDQALIKRGLNPGPKQQSGRSWKRSIPVEEVFEETQVEEPPQSWKQKRDDYYSKYGL
jgi:hypothetical protein